jgi:membrane protein implicated in regulation of membrane protease activity
MTMFWIIIIIVSLIIEALTFNLITIWISLGGLAAWISSYFTDNSAIQIIVFFVVTIVSLLSTRKLVKKFVSNDVKTNLDDVVGKKGIVIKEIIDDEVGRVKVMGKEWSAKSYNEKTIKENTKVEILEIKGVKLIVKEESK